MKWHSLFELLVFPIGILMVATVMVGLSNLMINPAFATLYSIQNDLLIVIAEAVSKVGTFLIVNFPLIFLLRVVSKKKGSATTIVSAFAGYVTYAVFTMYFARSDLGAAVYSAILGLYVTSSHLSSGVHYPLQTGIVATILIAMITLNSFSASRRRGEYGFFSFISKDTGCVVRTIILSALAGVLVAYGWPYVLKGITDVINFIALDTTNPINLVIYGIFDRLLSVCNLGTIIKTPFWYGTSGGSWVSIAGANVTGDVNIWTSQIEIGQVANMSGRFITPYYVLNIFAIPAMLWAFFSMQTDRLERSKLFLFYLFTTIISLFCGTILPVELVLLTLCPLLFFFHIACTGLMYGIFQAMHVSLGFRYTGFSTIAVNPGTLLELISYAGNTQLQESIIKVVIVGVIFAVIYFLATKFYFNYLALDLFRTGQRDKIIKGTIETLGGINNVKFVHSSVNRLVVSLYDPTLLDVSKLNDLGSVRIYETKAGYAICFGSASTMIRKGISKEIREYVRQVK